MEAFLDSTLLTILVIITFATLLALVRAQKRDRCLTHFHGYHITLAEKDGRVIWGEVDVRTSGLEIEYPAPRCSPKGFWKQSFLYYKDQYSSMDGLYRCTAGMSDDQVTRRARYLHRTANPGIFWRTYRNLRNWIGMVRDALVQSASLLIGVARKQAPASAAVLTRDEERIGTLSAEIIGHAGNSYDPLLEKHLYTRVIVKLTRNGKIYHYCGFLADYTSDFLEIIDAKVTATDDALEEISFQIKDNPIDGLTIELDGNFIRLDNKSGRMLLLHELIHGDDLIPIDAVIPDGFAARLRIESDFDPDKLCVVMATPERVDMLVPRSHALVRHGVAGLSREDLIDDDED